MSGAGHVGAGSPAGWPAYLESLAAFGMRPGLERASALLDALGRPQDAYRVIHVVGTNNQVIIPAQAGNWFFRLAHP